MKSKKFSKVLILKKSTISNLTYEQMTSAKGGIIETNMEYTCVTWCGCQSRYWFVCETDYTLCCLTDL